MFKQRAYSREEMFNRDEQTANKSSFFARNKKYLLKTLLVLVFLLCLGVFLVYYSNNEDQNNPLVHPKVTTKQITIKKDLNSIKCSDKYCNNQGLCLMKKSEVEWTPYCKCHEVTILLIFLFCLIILIEIVNKKRVTAESCVKQSQKQANWLPKAK